MVRFDAISLAARDTVRTFAADPSFVVHHFGCACDFPDVSHRRCDTVADLLLDTEYQSADVAIFHFGVHHSLFHALRLSGPQLRIVRFHNVTPASFVDAKDVGVIERSLEQIETLRNADAIWADSPCNETELLERGFTPEKLQVIPLAVEDPPMSRLADKAADPVRILFVGRFAPSKGLLDLVEAIARLSLPRDRFRVTLAGNTNWSDPAYLSRVRSTIARHGLEGSVNVSGTVPDVERERLFHEAHILAMPSYHEGFCRPVIEGLRAGCIPIVYDGYNLPHIVSGLGRVVPAGDIDGFANALGEVVGAVPISVRGSDTAVLPLDRGTMSARQFDRAAQEYVASFAFPTVARAMRDSVQLLRKQYSRGRSAAPAL
ncbi:glycosyltransferase [Micromonospora sp. STR1s_5]|nr:glycosyltransferase [Micromonospora sp. STR1s_5]